MAGQFEILIEDTAESFTCGPGETLLKAMVRLGRRGIPVGCRGGGCGVCKVRVTAGDCQRRRMSRVHVSEQDETQGIGLACCLIPRTNVRLVVIGEMRQPVLNAKPRLQG